MRIGYVEVVFGRRLAERAAFVTAALGIAMGVVFLLAPVQGYCRMEASSSQPSTPATPGPMVCGTQSLIQAQSVWPMPLLAIVAWSIAPLISYVGVRRRMVGASGGAALILFALLLEATTLISFGAAWFFVPYVLMPLVISTAIAMASRPAARRT